jgi:omega-hydroxy-beta-dihydromenaquinone-9 sulfotransferase
MAFMDDKLVFITGASRSGTTLLSFILRNHSRIFGLRELQYFGECWDPRQGREPLSEERRLAAATTIVARQTEGILAARPDDAHEKRATQMIEQLGEGSRDPAELFAGIAAEFTKAAGKEIPCEQTPRNIFYAEALLDMYPQARIVHMIRDPRAVMASQKQRGRRRHLVRNKQALTLWESLRTRINYHPYTMAKLWRRAAQEARRLDGRSGFMILRFEDLLTEPERTIRRLCEHIGVPFEPSMLDVGQINSSHQSAVGGARRGIHKDAIDTWRTKLTPGEIAIAERLCGSLMSHYGYANESTAVDSSELPYRLSYFLHLAGVVTINPRRAWIQKRAVTRLTTR